MNCHGHLPPIDMNRVSSVSILAAEHEVILQTLSCLKEIINVTKKENNIPLDHAKQVLEILRLFADKCHHSKEEDILFPALEEHYPDFGPTAVMRSEHVQGRALISEMADALTTNDPTSFSNSSLNYVALLESHIEKENEILFRIAQDVLSDEEDKIILEKYRLLEHKGMGNGTHERLLNIANTLASTYGIPVASDNPKIMSLLTTACACKKSFQLPLFHDNSFEKLSELAEKVSKVHGKSTPKMIHLAEEVFILKNLPTSETGTALNKSESKIKELTENFTPWPQACESVHLLFQGLKSHFN